MLTAPAINRRRTEYVWARAVNDRSRVDPLMAREKPALRKLATLLEMNQDHPAIDRNYDTLRAYLDFGRLHRDGIVATYTQNDLTQYAAPDYVGALAFGRAYPAGTATFLPKEVVNTLWRDTHVELDLVSAYPTMLVSAFRDLDLPRLSEYVRDPSLILNALSRDCGLGRKDVKKMVNVMICSYPKVPDDVGLGFANQDRLRDVHASSFYRDVMGEIRKVADFMEQHYKPFLETIKRKCESSGDVSKTQHLIGVALSHLLGDMENVAMRCVIGYLDERDETNALLNDFIWKFDGILVPREIVENVPMEAIMEHVANKTGITGLRMQKRELEGGFEIALSAEEMRDLEAYDGWKADFEKTYYRLLWPPVYGYIDSEGFHRELNKQQFYHHVTGMKKDYIKRWEEDPMQAMYKGKDFAPPPLFLKPHFVNTWRGLAASKLSENQEAVDIGLYLNHVRLLMGVSGEVDTPAVDYMHKLLAFKFQRPGDIWRVMVFIRSVQGVGKDIWLDFLIRLMGTEYGVRLGKVGELAGQYNSALEGKLLIGFSEMEGKDTRENIESLKDMITCTRVTIKKKYVPSFEINNSGCFIGFSNNFNAVKISADDRRMFSVTACGHYANKPEYHLPLIAAFEDRKFQRAVYDYYMGLDITDFDPSGDRVVTETMQDMVADSLQGGDILLKQYFPLWVQQCEGPVDPLCKIENGVLRLPVRTINEHFAVMANDLKYKDTDSKRKMDLLAKRLISEVSSRIESFFEERGSPIVKPIVTVKNHGVYYYKLDAKSICKYINKIGGAEVAEDPVGGQAIVDRFALDMEAPMEVEVEDEPVVANPLAMAIEIPNFNDAVAYENHRGAYAAGFVPGN